MTEQAKYDLRREIAEALDILAQSEDDTWYAIDDFGDKHFGTTQDKAIEAAETYGIGLPNWPNNEGDALKLCINILDRLNEHAPGYWNIEIGSLYVYYNQHINGGVCANLNALGRSAVDFAQLALDGIKYLTAFESKAPDSD